MQQVEHLLSIQWNYYSIQKHMYSHNYSTQTHSSPFVPYEFLQYVK